MNTAGNAVRVGIFFIIGVALLYVVYDSLSNQAAELEDGYTVQAPFEDILQLKPTDDVRMAGVRIGTVQATRLDGNRAVVDLAIERAYRIPENSVAMIEMAGLLGNNFVAIKPGDSPTTLQDGAQINTKETQTISGVIEELGQISDKVNNFLSSAEGTLGDMTGEGEGGLFSSVNQLVEDNREKVSQAVDNLLKVSEQLSGTEGTLGKLINSPEAYEELMAMRTDIKGAADSINKLTEDAEGIFGDIKAGKGALGVLLYDEEVATQLKQSAANIQDFSAKLNSEESTLGRLIGDDDLYQQAQAALDKVENAVGSMNDSGPITAVGVVSSGLF